MDSVRNHFLTPSNFHETIEDFLFPPSNEIILNRVAVDTDLYLHTREGSDVNIDSPWSCTILRNLCRQHRLTYSQSKLLIGPRDPFPIYEH